jgi:hypothetical protein
MNNTRERLELAASLLALIEHYREKTGDRELACGVEQVIVEQELRRVEKEILDDPGGLDVVLVPLRRRAQA